MVAMVRSAAELDVFGDQLAEIHAVKLVAAENEQVLEVMGEEMEQVLAHGVGRALVPGGVGEGLFGGQDFHKSAGEMVEFVGLGNMAVEGGGIELGQQINPLQARIDAVGNGDVHQAVFAGQGHGRLAAVPGEREAGAGPARPP